MKFTSKTFRRILALIMAAVLIFAVAGCKNNHGAKGEDVVTPQKKVAILVAPEAQYPEDYRAARELEAEYPNSIVIKQYDDSRILKGGDPGIITLSKELAADPEIGAIYNGVVTRLMSFGAFVEIAPGKEGLVHISRLDVKRTEKVEDVVNVGDTVLVKVLEIDDQGRLNLSRRDALIEVKGLTPENEIEEEPKKRDNNRRFNRRRNND